MRHGHLQAEEGCDVPHGQNTCLTQASLKRDFKCREFNVHESTMYMKKVPLNKNTSTIRLCSEWLMNIMGPEACRKPALCLETLGTMV